MRSRSDLGLFLNKRGLIGRGLELGVARGDFSRQIFDHWRGERLYLVDCWRPQPPFDYQDAHNVSAEQHDANFRQVESNLAAHCGRYEISRASSRDAAERFSDGSLDFVYIDANHKYPAIAEDLRLWWPKVKEGGLFSGADGDFYSTYPVAFGTGQPDIVASDLSSNGFGKSWGLTRTWSNAAVGGPGSYVVGKGWVVSEMPQVITGTNTAIVVNDASNQLYFDQDGSGQYHSRQDPRAKLSRVPSSLEWLLTDATGGQTYFLSGGQFEKYVDPSNNVTQAVYARSGDPTAPEGYLKYINQSSGNLKQQFQYYYITDINDPNYGMLTNVVQKTSSDNGTTWTDLREMDYDHYVDGNQGGGTQFLKTATLRVGSAIDGQLGTGAVIGTSAYRYNADGQLTYVFNPESYARFKADHGGVDPTDDSGNWTDAQLQPYADNYFAYGAPINTAVSSDTGLVTQEIAHNSGCSCSGTGGQGLYTYQYQLYPNGSPGYASSYIDGYNQWKMKAIEYLPDGNQDTVFTNFAGQPMLDIQQQLGPASSATITYSGTTATVTSSLASALSVGDVIVIHGASPAQFDGTVQGDQRQRQYFYLQPARRPPRGHAKRQWLDHGAEAFEAVADLLGVRQPGPAHPAGDALSGAASNGSGAL